MNIEQIHRHRKVMDLLDDFTKGEQPLVFRPSINGDYSFQPHPRHMHEGVSEVELCEKYHNQAPEEFADPEAIATFLFMARCPCAMCIPGAGDVRYKILYTFRDVSMLAIMKHRFIYQIIYDTIVYEELDDLKEEL
jgi:hypothetical protein